MEFATSFNKSERAIVEAYLSLLGDQRYDKVKVKDILERSGVVRSTFYAHFQDAYDVLDRIERQLLERLSLYQSSDKQARMQFAGMPFESMVNWFSVCLDLREVVAPVMGDNGDPYFLRRLQGQMRQELNNMMNDDGVPQDDKRPFYVELCMAGYVGILSYLVTVSDEDIPLSAREMASMANSARAAYFRLSDGSPDITDERLFGE